MNNFPEKLNKILLKTGYTQGELADQLGTSQPYISALLSGRRQPSRKLVARIKKDFAIYDEWWETGEGPMCRGLESLQVDVVREVGSEEEAVAHIRSLLPLAAEIIEIRYSDDLREEAVDYLLTLRGGQLQFVHTPLCLDTRGNERFVVRLRLGVVAYELSPYVVRATLSEIERLRQAQDQEELVLWLRGAKRNLLAEGDDVDALIRWVDLVSTRPNLIKEWVDNEIREHGHDGYLIAHLSKTSELFRDWLEKRKTAAPPKKIRWVVPLKGKGDKK